MTFDQLIEYVGTIQDEPGRCGELFGCECGCGGDGWTIEAWDRACEEADAAKAALMQIGIVFREDEV